LAFSTIIVVFATTAAYISASAYEKKSRSTLAHFAGKVPKVKQHSKDMRQQFQNLGLEKFNYFLTLSIC